MLSDIFSALGLDKEEAETYTLLLEVGPAMVSTLAKKLGKPRPSLYGFLKRLQDKGLVVQSLKSGVRTFSAEPPEKVKLLFRQRIEDLEDKQRLYNKLVPELEKNIPSKFLTPRFQLYEGNQGLQHVLKDMLLYGDIETQAFWPIKTMLEVLSPDFFRYHNKERIKSNISTRALWPASQIVDIKTHPYLGVGDAFKREIRIAPNEINIAMGYWIYKNKVAFLSSRKENFGFIVESRELVEMLLSHFELIWKLSKPISARPGDGAVFLEELV